MHQSVTWKSDSRAVSAGTSVRMSCAEVKNLNRAPTLSLKGRVDFTCLNCFRLTSHQQLDMW